ncbi:Hsp20/alpha crystallin family protein [uncultured Croceitalea sp.]|uniref:Hsp20/alpha crystallin family protein n=1 Tax=uncultured Croceitalea sp. TaxID=1798908 RepID=UPI00330640AA
MSLIRFSRNQFPWNENLADFFNRDTFVNDDFFNLEKSLPAMNIKEHEEDFEIELAAPGFDKKDFEITMKDDLLEVSAQKSKEAIEEDEDYMRKEFNYNSFKRTMQLPNAVDQTKNVKASYKNGILKLNLLKMDEAKEKPKRIIEVL